jgi:hypothetical protein
MDTVRSSDGHGPAALLATRLQERTLCAMLGVT